MLTFYNDSETGEPHIYNHGVSENEIEEVFQRRGREQNGRRGTRVRTGQTQEGRYLQVVFVPSEDRGDTLIITAFEPTPNEIAAFRRFLRKK